MSKYSALLLTLAKKHMCATKQNFYLNSATSHLSATWQAAILYTHNFTETW